MHPHRLLCFAAAAVASGCATGPYTLPTLSFVSTYYDRNRDGRVDYELHDDPTMADEAWALADNDFDGRYETKYSYGVVGTRSRVDTAVPKNVRLTFEKPEGGFGF